MNAEIAARVANRYCDKRGYIGRNKRTRKSPRGIRTAIAIKGVALVVTYERGNRRAESELQKQVHCRASTALHNIMQYFAETGPKSAYWSPFGKRSSRLL